MTSHAIAEGNALFFFRAVRDEFVGAPGVAVGLDVWDACEGAPTLTLAFADVAAIERLRDGLDELAKAMSARQGQDRNGLGATPASAVVADDLPKSQDLSTPLPSGSIER